VENGRIVTTLEMPGRNEPQSIVLRLRHPKSTPIKSVIVNGEPWSDFDATKEVIRLHDLHGTVKVETIY
jgi:hypothetical protein